MADLTHASREDLLVLVATLQARVAELERRLGASGGAGMPGTKLAAGTRSRASGQPRKQRRQTCVRQRSATPTVRIEHAARQCPDCGTALAGGWEHRTREVIAAPVSAVRVESHVIMARSCPTCQRRVLPAAPLAGVVGHRQAAAGHPPAE